MMEAVQSSPRPPPCCAYDALIAAPSVTLLDFPMLPACARADHHSKSMVDAALLAYGTDFVILWWITRLFDVLVASKIVLFPH